MRNHLNPAFVRKHLAGEDWAGPGPRGLNGPVAPVTVVTQSSLKVSPVNTRSLPTSRRTFVTVAWATEPFVITIRPLARTSPAATKRMAAPFLMAVFSGATANPYTG